MRKEAMTMAVLTPIEILQANLERTRQEVENQRARLGQEEAKVALAQRAFQQAAHKLVEQERQIRELEAAIAALERDASHRVLIEKLES